MIQVAPEDMVKDEHYLFYYPNNRPHHKSMYVLVLGRISEDIQHPYIGYKYWYMRMMDEYIQEHNEKSGCQMLRCKDIFKLETHEVMMLLIDKL